MNPYTTARVELATALEAQGFTVTTDPGTVNPPCAVVGPVTRLTRETQCGYRVEIGCYLVAAAPGGALSMSWLEDNLGAFLAAVLPATGTDVTLGTYTHPTGEMPAYSTTAELAIGG